MKNKISNINCDIIGLSEIRQSREYLMTLNSDYIFHNTGNEGTSVGRIGFVVPRKDHNKTILYLLRQYQAAFHI